MLGETVLEDLDTGRALVAEVEVGAVDAGSDVVVRVHVADRSRAGEHVEIGDLVTTESHPVLTRGHGDTVDVSDDNRSADQPEPRCSCRSSSAASPVSSRPSLNLFGSRPLTSFADAPQTLKRNSTTSPSAIT